MCECIAPHEGNEIDMVLSGKKKLAIIYRDKQPELYMQASYLPPEVLVRPERPLVVSVSLDIQYIQEYRWLVKSRLHYTREQYQRCMGKLLGYKNHEVEEFIQSEIGKTCTCVECGGDEELI